MRQMNRKPVKITCGRGVAQFMILPPHPWISLRLRRKDQTAC